MKKAGTVDDDTALKTQSPSKGKNNKLKRTFSSLYRRTFLAVTSALGISASVGSIRAEQNNESNETDKNNEYWDSLSISKPSRSLYTRYEVDQNGLGNAQPNTVPFSPRLATYNRRQYLAYWNHSSKLIVAARDLPTESWNKNNTGIEIGTRDGHFAPGLGIGPAGHIFISYNLRGSPIKWRRSLNPEDITSFGNEYIGMTGQNEDNAHYPEFTRLLNGTLLFGYRQGGSGEGDWILNR